jgi:hypothetical protein
MPFFACTKGAAATATDRPESSGGVKRKIEDWAEQ